MKTTALEQARNELQAQRIALRGTSDTLVSLHERANARVTELDEHTRRLADCIRHAKNLGDENRQSDAALEQCRNDIRAGLGPQFARDLWRELVDAMDNIDEDLGFAEIDAYLAIASWLYDRPKVQTFTPIKPDNVVLALKTATTVFAIWPELKAALDPKPAETTEAEPARRDPFGNDDFVHSGPLVEGVVGRVEVPTQFADAIEGGDVDPIDPSIIDDNGAA